MKNLVTLKNILLAIPLLFLLAGLHYALPQVDVVRAVGVEVKRNDLPADSSGIQRTRDVSFIQTETLGGDPSVYRNEDNFLYLKFDTENLQSQVQSFANQNQLIAVRHYGWRLTVFSMFPNALSAWPVEEGYRHIPVFNTIVLLALGGLGFMGFRRMRRISQAREEARLAREAERATRDAAAAREAQEKAQRARETAQKSQSDVDDFLNTGGSRKD